MLYELDVPDYQLDDENYEDYDEDDEIYYDEMMDWMMDDEREMYRD